MKTRKLGNFGSVSRAKLGTIEGSQQEVAKAER